MENRLTTKKQRLNWYKVALEGVKKRRGVYTCIILKWDCNDFGKLKYNYNLSKDLLPELWKRRTIVRGYSEGSWFNNRKERIKALEIVIDQMEKELLEEHINKGFVIMGIFTVVIVVMIAIFIHLK